MGILSWYDEPTEISKIYNTDYLLALDENGTDCMSNIDPFNIHTQWFTITGILFDLQFYDEAR